MACGHIDIHNVLNHSVHILYVPDPKTNQKVEMKGAVYMMFCERARPAGIEEVRAGLVEWERSQN